MNTLGLTFLNTAVQASYLVLALVLVRLIFKKAPRKLLCALWALVGLRLIVPFSLSSVFSLLPSHTPVAASTDAGGVYVQSGFSAFDHAVNTALQTMAAQQQTTASATLQLPVRVEINWAGILTLVWLCGVCLLAVYAIVSYLRLRLQVREAVKAEDGVRLCDRIPSPFILGVLRPRIYLPTGVAEGDRPLILAHERAHLKRRDHLWKPLGFLLLTLYWFNPVLWVAYVLLCRDIELACDERVLKEQGSEIKKAYAEALLRCSAPKHLVRACPVAFGETGVKGRIKSVLNYKKPAFWVVVLALVASAVVAVCFMTTPKEQSSLDRVSVLKIGGTNSDVYLEVSDLMFYDHTMLLHWKLHNDSGKTITLEKPYALERLGGLWKNRPTPAEATEQAPSGPPISQLVKNGVFAADTCLTDEFLCDAPGDYRFSLDYRILDGMSATEGGQVYLNFRVKPESSKHSAVRVLQTGGDSADVYLRMKKIGFEDAIRTSLQAEVEIVNEKKAAIQVGAGFSVYRLMDDGREIMLTEVDADVPVLLTAKVTPGSSAVLSVPLNAFPCTAPGTYRCMIHYMAVNTPQENRPSVSFDFEVLPRENDGLQLTVTDTHTDNNTVQMIPAYLTLKGKALYTEVIFVNRSNDAVEVKETEWILRQEDRDLQPLPVVDDGRDNTLFLTLNTMKSKHYGYTPSSFCDCTQPGNYRFQAHFRFGNEPEDRFPHVMWFDFKVPTAEAQANASLPDGMDEAIHTAILADNEDANWFGECATEGHFVYGCEQKGSTWKVYLYHGYERYGFINGYFTDVAGHWMCAVLTMQETEDGYTCKKIDYPRDGSENASSIKRLFPKKLEHRALNPTQSDSDEVMRQCEAQAGAYLKTIGREAAVVPYHQLNLQLPNLTTEVSNKLSNALGQLDGLYELTLGTREQLENGVRYVYRTSYMEAQNELLFTKERYDTQEVVESYLADTRTGEWLTDRNPEHSRMAQSPSFDAVVTEIRDGSVLMNLTADSGNLKKDTQVELFLKGTDWENMPVYEGAAYRVTYKDGSLMETYPLQLRDVLNIEGLDAVKLYLDGKVTAIEGDWATVSPFRTDTQRPLYGDLVRVATKPEVKGSPIKLEVGKSYRIVFLLKDISGSNPAVINPAQTFYAYDDISSGGKVALVTPTGAAEPTTRLTADSFTTYDASKGLTVYVWKMSERKTQYGLLPGAPESHTFEQTIEMPGVSLQRMREILQGYHISPAKVYVKPFQIPISSYLWEIDDGEAQRQREALGLTQQRTTATPPTTTKKIEPTTRTSEPFTPPTTTKPTEPTATTKPTEPIWTTRAYTPEEDRAIRVLGEEAVERFPDLKNTTNSYLEKAYVLMNRYPKFKKANVKSYDIGQDGDGYRDVTLHTDKGDFKVKYDGFGCCVTNNQETRETMGIPYYFPSINKRENVQQISLYYAFNYMMRDYPKFQGAFVDSFDQTVENDKVTVTLHTDQGDCTVVMGATGKYISTKA